MNATTNHAQAEPNAAALITAAEVFGRQMFALAQSQTPTPAANASPPQPPVFDPRLLWDLKTAAAALSISDRHLKNLMAMGELPPGAVVRLGGRRLFKRKLLEEWVAKGCPKPRK